MEIEIGKWGNSLAVRIPGPFAKQLELKNGMKLNVSLVDGAILIRPPHKKYTLDELLSGITPDNLHHETDWGEPAGRESW